MSNLLPLCLYCLVWNFNLFVRGCVQKADVIFLVDASGSVGTDNFKQELNFVAAMISNLTIGSSFVQVGVITFDNRGYQQVRLNQYHDKRKIQDAVSQIPYTRGGTSTDIALKFVLDEGFNSTNGDRDDAKDVLVVLTDGISVSPARTADQAYRFKEKHIKVISIGIGRGANKQELLDMASVPGYMFQVNDFRKLSIIQDRIHILVCNNDVITTPALQWFVG